MTTSSRMVQVPAEFLKMNHHNENQTFSDMDTLFCSTNESEGGRRN